MCAKLKNIKKIGTLSFISGYLPHARLVSATGQSIQGDLFAQPFYGSDVPTEEMPLLTRGFAPVSTGLFALLGMGKVKPMRFPPLYPWSAECSSSAN